ncbi:GNAT family N-acetyltransferase [Luteibacter sp. ME-Dv--P-043b]|uniref:GNAT family N-acetyltransferase n=1 Tax=Luteibacter sp. ME-Dv--P-043b TaxID=3040291 RepID=UPI002554CBCD|nr:GNAT family N-acetyltransferase [Luteibacter sp. ME-Dv--P-043b]
MSLDIRRAGPADADNLARWNTAMAWETEQKRLDPATVARGVRAVLDEPRRGFYLVAERDRVPVGCLMVTYEWSDWRCGDFWWVQSVYVEAEARGTGVFGALYRQVKAMAESAGAVGLRLYVELENERAQRTYSGLGMQRCHYHMYEAPLGD